MADILDVASLFDSIAFGYIPRDLYVVVHHQGTSDGDMNGSLLHKIRCFLPSNLMLRSNGSGKLVSNLSLEATGPCDLWENQL
ncbi:hypothetical protein MRB53_030968 [Persea americana]|uniref:Uncharacterized protein n=1 Tax=Persea americana TaxID=3435 RepID=A0ACC2KN89_PERAE|nr:hypothetical protein MRB53_030968 [Persea americana]